MEKRRGLRREPWSNANIYKLRRGRRATAEQTLPGLADLYMSPPSFLDLPDKNQSSISGAKSPIPRCPWGCHESSPGAGPGGLLLLSAGALDPKQLFGPRTGKLTVSVPLVISPLYFVLEPELIVLF